MRRVGVLAVLVALVAGVLVADAHAEAPAYERCGANDLPEGVALDGSPTPQLQGDVPKAHRVEDANGESRAEAGYNCGLAFVAREVLDGGTDDPPGYKRNAAGNANMAVASHCAYVSGPGSVFGPPTPKAANGVAVIDVSDVIDGDGDGTQQPVQVRTLMNNAGDTGVSETLYAVDAPERSLLVVGQYGNAVPPAPADAPPGPASGYGSANDPMNIYDVTGDKCENPELLETFVFPHNIHNLTISGNGRYVFATQPNQVVDLAPLFDGNPATGARYLGNLNEQEEYPVAGPAPVADLDDNVPSLPQPVDHTVKSASPVKSTSHQIWSNFDGTVLYEGGTVKFGEVFTVLDIKDWLQDQTKAPKVISQRSGRGHSVTWGSIEGQGDWVLHSEESVFGAASGCYGSEGAPFVGTAEPSLSNFTDPAHPTMHVSKIGLEINRMENCQAQQDSGVQASAHYHEFDRTDDAKIAIISMQNAGIRVFDVRDPAQPKEIAYFNPGDVNKDAGVQLDNAWGHPHYDEATGTIWFATSSGGFWVVALEKQLLKELKRSVKRPLAAATSDGVPGTLPAAPLSIDFPLVDLPPLWCTLSTPLSAR
jgi:hypothetical protein